jgi:hypothetical protein
MRRTHALALALALSAPILLVACQGEEENSLFRHDGTKTGEETGQLDDTGKQDTGMEDCSPVLSEATVRFTVYPNISNAVVEFRIPYADPEDDVVGGVLHVELTPSGGESVIWDLEIAASESFVIADEGEILAAIADVDESKTYGYLAWVFDDALCRSNTLSGPVAPR